MMAEVKFPAILKGVSIFFQFNGNELKSQQSRFQRVDNIYEAAQNVKLHEALY